MKNKLIGVIYRPPDLPFVNFELELVELLNKVNTHQYETYILGDFNLDLLKHGSCNSVESFLNIMFSNSFCPTITKPTRITPTTASLLDNIFINTDKYSQPLIFTVDISDHLPVSLIMADSISFLKKDDPEDVVYKRIVNESNLQKFMNELQTIDSTIYI